MRGIETRFSLSPSLPPLSPSLSLSLFLFLLSIWPEILYLWNGKSGLFSCVVISDISRFISTSFNCAPISMIFLVYFYLFLFLAFHSLFQPSIGLIMFQLFTLFCFGRYTFSVFSVHDYPYILTYITDLTKTKVKEIFHSPPKQAKDLRFNFNFPF